MENGAGGVACPRLTGIRQLDDENDLAAFFIESRGAPCGAGWRRRFGRHDLLDRSRTEIDTAVLALNTP